MNFEWIQNGKPALVLAPMEGVTEAPMRALLSERGGFTFCVSEFLRISHELLPHKTYYRHMIELKNGSRTANGTYVQLQLLGDDPELLAQSAYRGYQLGARAIDLNFGCPAKMVNKNSGGAALLKTPEKIFEITAAVRKILPSFIPVSAKLRLGWENKEDIFINAEQAAKAGASWLTIHARTKTQGYAPPVDWSLIKTVRKNLALPIVANGDIWTREDFLRCQEVTGCEHFMLGRGALSDPSLPLEISRILGISSQEGKVFYPFSSSPQEWEPLLYRLMEICEIQNQPCHTPSRFKQWLNFPHIKKRIHWFDQIKKTKTPEEFFKILPLISDFKTKSEERIKQEAEMFIKVC